MSAGPTASIAKPEPPALVAVRSGVLLEGQALRLLQGDCLQVLPTLESGSVQCCVTSPPYWGLRDYGVAGQLGLEPTPEEYTAKMVAVFRELRRVLRDDGTLWLNLGDTYASGDRSTYQSGASDNKGQQVQDDMPRPRTPPGLKPKDLVGIPWRVAFALQADGWYLRSDIIWHKPNPMPESVTDRPTKSHEYIFLLTKSQRYFYDAEAVKEPAKGWNGSTFDGPRDLEVRPTTGRKPRTAGKWSLQEPQSSGRRIVDNVKAARANGAQHDAPHGEWRNKRSVWTVTTKAYKEAHFATFPPDLVKPCILSGCPVGGIVLDPFAGSGTTGAVALEFGRRAVMIELNPEYTHLANERCRTTPGLPLAL